MVSDKTGDSKSLELCPVPNNSSDVTVNPPSDTSYKPYSFFYDDKGYGEKKLVWSTDVDKAAEKIAESKGVTFNATVQNPDDPVALHTNLTEALTTYVDSGAIVTILEDLEHVYDYQNGPVNRPTIMAKRSMQRLHMLPIMMIGQSDLS